MNMDHSSSSASVGESSMSHDKMQVDIKQESNGVPRKRAKRRHLKPEAVRYHCNYCRKDISNVIRIKCAQCADFDLCVECFSVGVEIGAHKNNHDYSVMDTLSFPLFDEDWGADEELLLLEGIEMYGLGNWGDVSDHVGTKLPSECKEHYFSTYINVPTAPLPDLSKVLTTPESLQLRNSTLRDDADDFEEDVKPMDKKREDSPPPRKNEQEFAGFMSKRGDYETEYENDAEALIADMSFTDDDPSVERDLKLRILSIYNHKLDERARRKAFIQERNLLEFKKLEKKLPKEEREVHDRLKVFARLLTKEEHEDFVNGMIAEKQLRKRIEELKKYRRLGITALADISDFEGGKKRKSLDGESLTRRQRDMANSMSGTSLRSQKWINRDRELKWSQDKIKLKPRKPGTPLDITSSTGYDLLSDKERELCSSLRLFPQQYMMIKDTLLRENLKAGHLKKASARQLIKIDVNKTGRIFDFFVSCGWINKEPRESNGNHMPPLASEATLQVATNTPPPLTMPPLSQPLPS